MPRGMRGGGRGGARRARRRRRRVRRRRVMLVGGLVGFGVYKMTKSQASEIEQHTGVPPEEMTDEELSQSMDDLNIPKQTIDPNDQEEASGAGGAASGAATTDWANEITKLAELRDNGVLTDEEFTAKKKQILGL